MRADIHDGPEHILQSETEYIDARLHQPASTNPLAARGRTIHSGHKPSSHPARAMSRLPQIADIASSIAQFGSGPLPDSCIATNCGVFDQLVRHKLRGLIRAAPLSEGPQSLASRVIVCADPSSRIL